MNANLRMLIPALVLFAAVALPVQVSAQDKQEQTHQHHTYKLFDLGTLGGPNSGNESIPPENIINLGGVAAAYGDTSVPDPFCLADCFVNHAFVWKEGATTDLGALPGGANSFASSINARGEVAGASQNGQIDPLTAYPEVIAVLWKNGIIDNLGTLGGTQSVANSISDRGQVAGAALNAISDPFASSPLPCSNCGSFSQFFLFVPAATQAHAFRWTEARGMQDLGALGGPDSSASFVNQRGQIAGEFFTSFTANAATGVPTVDPFFWENGHMVDIGTLGGTFGYPFWMNNRGQVVGNSNLAGDQITHAFLWDRKNGLKDLGTLGGSISNASWINDGGEIVGGSDTPADAEYHPFLWKNGAMTDLGTVAGDRCTVANSINLHGQIVGLGSADCNNEDHAFLSENGSPVMDLQTLVQPGSGLTLIDAIFINDRGEIAARAKLSNDDEHAVVLIPCDEGHPDVEGCDYSMVDVSAAARASDASVSNNLPRKAPDPSAPTLPAHGMRALLNRGGLRFNLRQEGPRSWAIEDHLDVSQAIGLPSGYCGVATFPGDQKRLTGYCVGASANHSCSATLTPSVCHRGQLARNPGLFSCARGLVVYPVDFSTKCSQ